MKKTILFILSLVTIVTFTPLSSQNFYLFEIEEQSITSYDGVSHTYHKGVMTYGTEDFNVEYNVLDIDFDDEDIHLVTVSDYQPYVWGMNNLLGMILKYQNANPHVEVLAGINGDFYDINNTGHPSHVFVQDYEVIKGHPISNRYVFNIREEGTFDIDLPKMNGYEILIFNEMDEVKYRGPIIHNSDTYNTNNNYIYTTRFNGDFDFGDEAIVIDATSMRHLPNGNMQSVNGALDTSTNPNEIDTRQVVLIGDEIKSIVGKEDRVLIQPKIVGYEDVRGTMGGSHKMVDNGVAQNVGDEYRHPRTAIGIREDGTVFFINNHGRIGSTQNPETHIPGLKIKELGKLMETMGAIEAINLDGGGSSTMVVKNHDGNYEAINNLSDGNIRSISNAILVVRGDINQRPIEIDLNDEREKFSQVQNIMIDENNTLYFEPVEQAERYIIETKNQRVEISQPIINLDFLRVGQHEITITVKGTSQFKASDPTAPIQFNKHTETALELIDWIKNFTKYNN